MHITLEHADRLAVEAHSDTTTRAGGSVVDHVRRVAAHFDPVVDGDAAVAAMLHDSVEKGSFTFDDLRDAGVAEHVVEIVDALTERPEEPVRDYLARCAAHPVALRVKRVDIADKFPSPAARHRAELLEELAFSTNLSQRGLTPL